MIEVIGWIALVWGVLIVGTAIAKKLWPEDWDNKDPFN